MRKIVILLLCLYHGIGFSQRGIVYYKPNDATTAETGFVPKPSLKDDIAFWQKVMEESHVNLYHNISKEKLAFVADSLLAKLPESVSHQQALLVMGVLAASLNEGHIYLPTSPATDSLYINRSVRFPFGLSNITDSGSLIVESDWSSEHRLEKGSRIISINGVLSQAYYNRYRQFFGGLERWRQQQVSIYFRKLLFLDGQNSPYDLVAVASNGDTLRYRVNGLDKFQVDSLNKVISNNTRMVLKEPFSFETIDGNIAFIRFNSMSASLASRFGRFLDSTFAVIKQNKCRGVVIDIRENGGGDSQLGETLINYIASKPYRMGGGMKWKVSSHYKAFMKIMNNDDESYSELNDGEMLESIDPPTEKPNNNVNTFHGNVALLIGPNTFSSANMLADGISTYHLAKVFGEASGQCGNDYGEMFNFMLPNTRIVARASTKMFIRASGNEQDPNPTLPDIEVKRNTGKTNEDAALKAAVDWLLHQ